MTKVSHDSGPGGEGFQCGDRVGVRGWSEIPLAPWPVHDGHVRFSLGKANRYRPRVGVSALAGLI